MKSIILLPFLALILLLNSCANGQVQNTNLSPKEFAAKIVSNLDAVIIDVRTPDEFVGGHLKNAQNIDWDGSDFEVQVQKIDKSKPVFVYCLSGGRSSSAAAKMRTDGFKEVYEMNGGMMKWRAAQLPETRDNAVAKPSEMSRADYDKMIQSDKIVLVDFYADWCKPCKMMKPYLEEIAKEMKDKVVVMSINADENHALCQDLSVDALPTIFVYKNGVMMWHNVGYVAKEEVLKYLK